MLKEMLVVLVAVVLAIHGTATKLQTARTIGITGGATGTATSFDGSKNISIPVTSLNPDNLSKPVPINKGGTGNTTGNAASATKLQTARNIKLQGDVAGSANFDGSANITINTEQKNIVVFTGQTTLTGKQEKTITINYPEGFNSTNCVILAFGVGKSLNNLCYENCEQITQALHFYNPTHFANLDDSKITLKLRYGVEALTDQNSYPVFIQVVLMKIPNTKNQI